MSSLSISWQGAELALLPERAIWFEEERILLVADVHLGKDQVFRRHGIALPAGSTGADLVALESLVQRLRPATLVVLGDLVHAPPSAQDEWPEEILRWRQRQDSLNVQLVLGNHDRSIGPWLTQWSIEPLRNAHLADIALAHEPPDSPNCAVLCGHLHPVFKLRDGRRGTMRLPCFWFSGRLGVLPSFGQFTGGLVIEPERGDGLYGVAAERVIPIQSLPAKS